MSIGRNNTSQNKIDHVCHRTSTCLKFNLTWAIVIWNKTQQLLQYLL